MDAREKLVDILDHIYLPMMDGPNTIGEYHIPHELNEEIADHLITNGVTMQEWISVDDRLPIEEAKAHEQEWPGEYCEFLVMIEKGSLPTTLYYDLEENEWFRINTALERETYEVTHWMPLPLPPKGE